jgi:hypothetical protein
MRWSQAVAVIPLPTLPLVTVPASPAPTPACDVCPHAAESHDAIGERFCRATLAGAITRGCICRST